MGARHSHLALAAASRRIRELEAALGSPLFERHARGLVTTAAGEAFVRHGLNILGELEFLVEELIDIRQGVSKRMRLWASTAAITQFLSPLLARFGRLEPHIRIDLEEQVSEVVMESLLDGRADVGILIEGYGVDSLDMQAFAQDELALVLPRGHSLAGRRPVAFVETLSEDYIGLSSGAAVLQRQQQTALAAGKAFKLRMQVRSFDAACRMVASGLGLAILPKEAVSPFIRPMSLVTRPLSDAWAIRNIMVAMRVGETDASIHRLVKFLVDAKGGAGSAHPSRLAKAASRRRQ